MVKVIEDKIIDYVLKENLIEKGNHIVVGVSGGADSMALLHFLFSQKDRYQITLTAAHVHHGVREAATEDAEYVKAICSKWKIPFFIHHCNIKTIAKQRHITEEEAGREERYNFFISLTKPNDKIAVAHNMNDQAETMLMRFFRGADIKGLGGIPAKRQQIIRPLLNLTRDEIEKYCDHYQIAFKTDQTNLETTYTRNKIRLECIPYIQRHLNPGIIKTLAQHSQLYLAEEDFISDYVQKLLLECIIQKDKKLWININQLQKEKEYIQKRLLLECIILQVGGAKDITSVHVQQVWRLLTKQVGKSVNLPYGLIVTRHYEQLVLSKQENLEAIMYNYTLEEGTMQIKQINAEITLSFVSRKTFEQCKENMYTKYIDYAKIKDALRLRIRKPGDYITLTNGSKKLKDFFIDEKICRETRNSMPLIADDNEIIWIIGSRLNVKYYVTDQTTQIIEIKFTKC